MSDGLINFNFFRGQVGQGTFDPKTGKIGEMRVGETSGFGLQGQGLSAADFGKIQEQLRSTFGKDMSPQRDMVAKKADGTAIDPKTGVSQQSQPHVDPKAETSSDPNQSQYPKGYREMKRYTVAKGDEDFREGFRDAPGSDRIAKMQEEWKQKGLYTGNVDGMWGPLTQQAYEASKKPQTSGVERVPQTGQNGAIVGGERVPKPVERVPQKGFNGAIVGGERVEKPVERVPQTVGPNGGIIGGERKRVPLVTT